MKISEVRLRNLQRLLERYRYDKDFCEAVEISPTYLSQVKAGTKNLGDDLVERIEKNLGLPTGEMDSQTLLIEESMEHAVSAMAHAIESLPKGVRTHLAALVFELARNHMTNAPVAPFDKVTPDEERHDAKQSSPTLPAARRR